MYPFVTAAYVALYYRLGLLSQVLASETDKRLANRTKKGALFWLDKVQTLECLVETFE